MSFAFRPRAFAEAQPVPVHDAVQVAPDAPALPRLPVIGLSGPGGCGKSTVAAAIVAEWRRRHWRESDSEVRIIHVADPLKNALGAILYKAGLSRPEVLRRLDGDLKRKPCAILGGHTPTHAMQTMGTEWGRKLIHPDFWVNIWRTRAEAALAEGDPVVNDSVRFPNEAAAIRALGGVVVHLTGRAGDLAPDHESERQTIAADFSVANDGTPEASAAAILDEIEGRQIAAAHKAGGVWSRMADVLTRRADRARW